MIAKNNDFKLLVPKTFEEYLSLPANVRDDLSNFVLRDAVAKIAKSVADPSDPNGLDNAQEAFNQFLKEPYGKFPKQGILIKLGQYGMDKAEIFMDWLYDKYMKLAHTIHRRKYE